MRTRFGTLLAAAMIAAPFATAQSGSQIQALVERLDRVESENQKLLDEIRQLRSELAAYNSTQGPKTEEQVAVNASRIEELDQTKIGSSQKMPVSLTGMLLFNAFLNGKDSQGLQDPVVATTPGVANSGGSLRQTVLGLKFSGPDLPWGGKASGSIYMDFYSGAYQNNVIRLRVATLDLKWGATTVTVGQDKPIISPREPTSLAQVGVSPLTASGNLWDWNPQVRVEHNFRLGDEAGVIAQAGVYETSDGEAANASYTSGALEQARPGYEERLELYREWGGWRVEIAPGFHASTTHALGASILSRIASVDWLIRPNRFVDLTGEYFQGRNPLPLGSLGQGFAVTPTYGVVPVHAFGGWGQLTLLPASRLSVHLYAGEENDRGSDLLNGGITRNLTYAGNVMLHLAPNVIAAFEASQTRTDYINAPIRINDHYDVALAYLF